LPNFVQIGQSVAKILRFFNFSRWRPPPSWIIEIVNFYLFTVTGVPRRITVTKFCQNRSFRYGYIVIFRIFKMAAAAILYFRNSEFLFAAVICGSRCITVPNFVKIARSIAEILRFFEFSRWPRPPSWIFVIAKFYWLLGSRAWRRIGMPNFVKIGQSIAKILRFFNFSRWRPSAILDLFGAHLDNPQ